MMTFPFEVFLEQWRRSLEQMVIWDGAHRRKFPQAIRIHDCILIEVGS